jgi:hypothetical protein
MSPRVQRCLRVLVASCHGALVWLAACPLCAQTNQVLQTNDIPKELLATPDLSLPMWNPSLLLRGAFGYKDNVLFSSQQAKGSAYAQTGLDASIIHLMDDGSSFFLMVTGDDTRYLNEVESRTFSTLTTTTIGNEDDAIVAAQYRWSVSGNWQPTLSLQYLYQNQVFNVATEPGVLNTEAAVQAVGNNVTLRPYVHGQLAGNWWTEIEWRLTRQWFSAPLFTYWLTGPRLTLGHALDQANALALTYEVDRILYDNENLATVTGAPIPSSLLHVWQQQADLRFTHYFDTAQHWSAVSHAGLVYNADNGSGFYDYYNYRFGEDAVFQAGGWKCKVQALYWRFDFPWQSAGASTNSKLERDVLTLLLRAEKKLSRHWSLFAQYQHDASLSNDPSDRYEAEDVQAGVELEF